MARKPNYDFERREREKAKAAKAEERAKAKAEKAGSGASAVVGSTTEDSAEPIAPDDGMGTRT